MTVVTVDGAAADAHYHGIHRHARPLLGLTHGRADTHRERLLIGQPALVPADGRDFAVTQITQLPIVHAEDDATGERASGIETHCDPRFIGHRSSPPIP